MAEKKLSFTAEEIDELLRKVDEGELGGASPEQIQQIQKNKDDIDALKAGKLDVEDVADWAKQPQKPEYTPEEIGAQPKGSYITTESDPTVPNWAKSPTKPSYTATEIGAEPANAVSAHNTSSDSHGDIRLLITELTTRLNTLANSTDTDLDQMAELVAYIKANRGLIEQVTSGKVSVTDIVNNLTTNVSNKPLSAAQGVTLKGLIDTLQTAVNAAAKATDLATHTGNTTIHITAAERSAWNKKQDPQTTLAGYGITDGATKAEVSQLSEEIADHEADGTIHVTSTEKQTWNNKSNFSGSYNDLSNKPTIPTVPSSLKNPYALTITLGSDTYTYDGSKAVSVAIADGNGVTY